MLTVIVEEYGIVAFGRPGTHSRYHRFLLCIAGLILFLAVSRGPSFLQAQPQLPASGDVSAGVNDATQSSLSDGWGPIRDGLRSRLFPAQKDYAIGQPATFGLEIENTGDRDCTYDPQQVDVNDSMRITDSDGKPVRYVGGSFQTVGRRRSISGHKTLVVIDSVNLAEQYLFVRPGKYTIAFRGQEKTNIPATTPGQPASDDPDTVHFTAKRFEIAIPPSNKITIEMRPAVIGASIQIPVRLVEILPKKWDLSLNGRVREVVDEKIAPMGWSSGAGTYLSLETCSIRGLKNDVQRVEIWVAERQLVWTGKTATGQAVVAGETPVYLGKGVDGYVYWSFSKEVEREWPDFRNKVCAALRIERTGKLENKGKSGSEKAPVKAGKK
jgi:hypothetical protein